MWEVTVYSLSYYPSKHYFDYRWVAALFAWFMRDVCGNPAEIRRAK